MSIKSNKVKKYEINTKQLYKKQVLILKYNQESKLTAVEEFKHIMNKQPSTKSHKVKNSAKKFKSNKVKKSKTCQKQLLVVKSEQEYKPCKIYAYVCNIQTVKKLLNSVSLTEQEAEFCREKVKYPINNNKLKIAINSKNSLRRNQNLDTLLKEEFEEKINSLQSKSSLPIFQKRKEILDFIEKNSVIVVHGEPQSGKTTQIPQFILNEFIKSGNGSLCKIVSTQPGRKNILSAVEKVTKERTEIFGNAAGVNYRVRFDSFTSRKAGSITYCTSGCLLRKLSYSSYLNQISHLIIDEIQERDIFTDVLLSFVKQIITERNDLKVILICSTVYSKKIRKYFNKCEHINVSAELYPVAEYFLQDVLIMTDFNKFMSSAHFEKDTQIDKRKYPVAITKFVKSFEKSDRINFALIVLLLKCIYNKYKEGNILIFLPAISDLRSLKDKIEKEYSLNSKTQVIPLIHFEMESNDNEINSNRKIYLTTNEKYVNNLENILFVINSGKVQIKYYDVITNIETIQNEWISLKTLRQRKNFAGYVKAGFCFHLFSEDTKQNFDKYPTPEIKNCDLEKLILDLKGFGIENTELFLKSCMTCTDIFDTRKAIETLKTNHILTNEEFLTPLGFNVSKLFQKYAVGKMIILGALFSCLEPILTIAAYLNFRSIFIGKDAEVREEKHKFTSYSSDTLLILSLLKEFEISNDQDFYKKNLIRPILKDIQNIRQELADILYHMNFLPSKKYENEQYNVNSKNFALIKALLSVAFYPNIAVIKDHWYDCKLTNYRNTSIETIKYRNVFIHPSSVNKGKCIPNPLIIYRNLQQSKHAFIQETTCVSPLQVAFFANDVKYSTEKHYSVITIADSLKINCSRSTSSTIKSVQEKFNFWLENKLKNPAYVDWKETSWSTLILKAVVHLFNNEEIIYNIADIGV